MTAHQAVEDAVQRVCAAYKASHFGNEIRGTTLDALRAELTGAQGVAEVTQHGIAHSLGGFRGGFASEHGRKPTEQEIWNHAIRAWRDLNPATTAPAQAEQPASVLDAKTLHDMVTYVDSKLAAAHAQGISRTTTARELVFVISNWSANNAKDTQAAEQGDAKDAEKQGMTIARALQQGLRAEVWLDGGEGPKACVGICAIQLQGWWHTGESAKAYADAYNRGAENMRAAILAKPGEPT